MWIKPLSSAGRSPQAPPGDFSLFYPSDSKLLRSSPDWGGGVHCLALTDPLWSCRVKPHHPGWVCELQGSVTGGRPVVLNKPAAVWSKQRQQVNVRNIRGRFSLKDSGFVLISAAGLGDWIHRLMCWWLETGWGRVFVHLWQSLLMFWSVTSFSWPHPLPAVTAATCLLQLPPVQSFFLDYYWVCEGSVLLGTKAPSDIILYHK